MKRVVVLAVVVALGAGLILIAIGRWRSGPRWAGRSVSDWAGQLNSTSALAQWEANRAVQGFGSNAVPELVRQMQAEDSAFRSNAVSLLRKQDLWPPLRSVESPAEQSREVAVRGFTALGAESEAAVTALVRLLDDPRTADHAGWALMQMDNRVIPALLIAVTNPGVHVRRRAIVDLGHRHTNAPGVQRALVAQMRGDPDRDTRVMAASALGDVPNLSPDAIQALVAVWVDPVLCPVAIEALGKAGAAARPAVPALERVLDDPVKYGFSAEAAARRALHQIEPAALTRRGIVYREAPNPFE